MPEDEPLTPGALANQEFVASKRAEDAARQEADPEYTGLAAQFPAGCLDCSSAWLHATNGRIERVEGCQGRYAKLIGEKTVMLCRLPQVKNSLV